jgi:RNA polymerase sigma-70 factor (ECF subfamily)
MSQAVEPRSSRVLPLAPDSGDRTTDAILVEAVLSGERNAFSELVGRHQRGVLAFAARMTGDREAAPDIAQETFLKAFCSLGSFDPRFRFSTWLYRIASNCAVDHLRRRRARIPSRAGRDAESESPETQIRASDPSPDQLLRCRELAGRLDEEIRALPPRYRQLLHLRHKGQLRYDEIARATGIPIGTVKNRIFRAREILRNRLADVLDGEG